MWTRKKALVWIKQHQYIATDGDSEDVVIDGDGHDLYQSLDSFNNDLGSEELGKLLAFVFNDYMRMNSVNEL